MTEPGPARRSLPEWARLHLWQMQPVRDVLLGLSVFALIWVGQKTSVVTVPLLLAVLLAYLFEPLIAWLVGRIGMSRRVAVGGIIASAVMFVAVPAVLALTFGVAQLVLFGSRTVDNIVSVQAAATAGSPEESGQIIREWNRRHGWPEGASPGFDLEGDAEPRFSPSWQWVYEQLTAPDSEQAPFRDALQAGMEWVDDNQEQVATTAANFGIETVNRVLGWVGAAFGLGFMAFVTLFFFFFMSTEWVKVKGFGTKLLPDNNRDRIVELLQKFDGVISGFIRGRLTIAFLQAIVFSFGYFLIGVPGAFLLGPAVAVLSIVPYLALVGVPVSIALLWLEGHTGVRGAWWWVVGAPLAVYFIGQALDDYVFTPLIQGKSTGMDTPTILFASLAGGALFGVFGLLIAIPIAACVKILVQEIFWPRFKEWAEGRAGDPLPIKD
jgi:predicted PurR-regulated permease PerM|tara:strand:- start:31861 stop:33174 length:1314 start_codon:yes stop_codon:yes gene_type:complete